MNFFANINYLAFSVSVLVYFMIGAFWFSILFGKVSVAVAHIKKTPENKRNFGKIFEVSFLVNVIICYACASMVHLVHPVDFFGALRLGITLGIGFMAAPFALNYLYGPASAKLTMIDTGFHIVGIVVVTVLMSMWH